MHYQVTTFEHGTNTRLILASFSTIAGARAHATEFFRLTQRRVQIERHTQRGLVRVVGTIDRRERLASAMGDTTCKATM